MAHILLVEDDRTIQMALEYALTHVGYEVSVASDGEAGLEAARTCDPDLILLDILLPKRSGLEVARILRASDKDTPIIMLTALDQEDDKIAGLDAGADDYVTKPFSTAELLARIRAHLRRVRVSDEPPSHIETGELLIDTKASRVLVAGKQVRLRNKEYALLVALASREGSLCTREWLTERVWGQTFLPTSRTLDTHVRRVRRIIDVDGWTYIHTERGMGYRFEPRHAGEREARGKGAFAAVRGAAGGHGGAAGGTSAELAVARGAGGAAGGVEPAAGAATGTAAEPATVRGAAGGPKTVRGAAAEAGSATGAAGDVRKAIP